MKMKLLDLNNYDNDVPHLLLKKKKKNSKLTLRELQSTQIQKKKKSFNTLEPSKCHLQLLWLDQTKLPV